MLSATKPQAATPLALWASHPILTAFQPSLQITADCWALLAAPDGSSRKENYLPKGEREPETAQPLSPRKDPPHPRAGAAALAHWPH